MYKVDSEARIERQETRLIALWYEIRVIHEFQLLQSPIGDRRSTLKKEAGAENHETRLNCVVLRDSFGLRIFTSSFSNRRSIFDIKKKRETRCKNRDKCCSLLSGVY